MLDIKDIPPTPHPPPHPQVRVFFPYPEQT